MRAATALRVLRANGPPRGPTYLWPLYCPPDPADPDFPAYAAACRLVDAVPNRARDSVPLMSAGVPVSADREGGEAAARFWAAVVRFYLRPDGLVALTDADSVARNRPDRYLRLWGALSHLKEG